MTERKEANTKVRLCVDVDEKTYIDFKKKTAEERKDMTEVLRTAIAEYLNK